MANHKSAAKRAKQNTKRALANKVVNSKMKTQVKKIRAAIQNKEKVVAEKLLKPVQSLLGKLSKSGYIKKNTMARRTSRLSKQVNKL